MQLELTIAGLCMLVDDATEDVVHVLMPTTGHHHAAHQLMLIHPQASQRKNTDIGGYSTDFSSLIDVAARRPDIPKSVLDITAVCSDAKLVPRDVLDRPHAGKFAHLKLRGGRISIRNRECCTLKGQEYSRAGQLLWTVDTTTGSGDLILDSLANAGQAIKVPLSLVDEVLRVGLAHAEQREMPDTLEKLHDVGSSNFDHFTAFYSFYPGLVSADRPTACDIGAPSQCMGTKGAAA